MVFYFPSFLTTLSLSTLIIAGILWICWLRLQCQSMEPPFSGQQTKQMLQCNSYQDCFNMYSLLNLHSWMCWHTHNYAHHTLPLLPGDYLHSTFHWKHYTISFPPCFHYSRLCLCPYSPSFPYPPITLHFPNKLHHITHPSFWIWPYHIHYLLHSTQLMQIILHSLNVEWWAECGNHGTYQMWSVIKNHEWRCVLQKWGWSGEVLHW